MEGRLITDLHGHSFKCSDYKISKDFPSQLKRGGITIMDRDIITHTSFILVKRPDKTYGYIFYENYVYVYGELYHVNYDPKSIS